MKLLILDTSSLICRVILSLDDKKFISAKKQAKKHASMLLPEINNLLTKARLSLNELDAIAFTQGPGSFTGVRIATACAQALSLGQDLPLIGLSTLQLLAESVYLELATPSVLALFNARMDEVYYGAYQLKGTDFRLINKEGVQSIDTLVSPFKAGEAVGVGDGWHLAHPELINKLGLKATYPNFDLKPEAFLRLAQAKYKLKEFLTPTHAVPVYLRDQVASV